MADDPELPAQGSATLLDPQRCAGLRPDWVSRIGRLLDALNSARSPQDLAMIGAGFHALRGDLKGRYAMTVSRNWRLTFGWDGEDAIEVDLEDYHG